MNKDVVRYDFVHSSQGVQNTLFASALCANHLHGKQITVETQQLIKSGFSSDGIQVGLQTTEHEKLGVFAKVTPVTVDQSNAVFLRETIQATQKELVGIPPVYGIFGVLRTGEVSSVSGKESDSFLEKLGAIIAICQLIDPTRYIPLVDLMKQFGIQTIQTGRTQIHPWFTKERLTSLYHSITDQMVAIHANRARVPKEKIQQEAQYRSGIMHVITSRERFDTINAIGQTIPSVVATISPSQSARLRENMLRLVKQYTPHASQRIAPIHGDAWMANRLVGSDGDSWLIDPAPMPFGDPAYDVVFGYADLVFTQINRNAGKKFAGEFSELAEANLREYIHTSGDRQTRKFMALFYGYKAFVSAVFDAGDNQVQRCNLFYSALGATQLALQKDFEFSFLHLDEYARIGRQLTELRVKRNAQRS